MKRFYIEGFGEVRENHAVLTTFCENLDKVMALKEEEVARGVEFHSGMGTTYATVIRLLDDDTPHPRDGVCTACGKPVRAHFDSRNRKLSCEEVK